MIVIKNLVKTHKSIKIIDNLTIEFKEKLILLYGENGVGKSTLIKILAGIIRQNSGFIYIDNKEINFTDSTYKKNIGFCIDYPTYPSHLRLQEYINLLNYVYKIDVNINKEYQHHLIAFFELSSFLNHKVSELSTGYEKRVKLFASMLHNPKLFIWDEPFASLDKNFTLKLIKKINELSKSDKHFFISSHITENFKLNFEKFDEYKMLNGKIEKIIN